MRSQYQSYIDGWRTRTRKLRDRRRAREVRARAQAERLAEVLAQEFNVRRVFLFGSLAREGDFHSRSDLDLAVEGLPRHQYLTAVERLEEEAGVHVDLIDLAEANDRVVRAIDKEGRLLYEAPVDRGNDHDDDWS